MIHAFTQANLDNSLGRMKTKEIIAAVNNLKVVFKDVCKKCAALPSETNKLIGNIKEVWNSRCAELMKSVTKDSEDMRPLVDELQEAFQTVCLTCAKVSNDDNPSNHGQTFVSLDSGNCQADSGRAKTTHTDDNIVQSRADWIGLHKSPDVEDQTYGMSPYTSLVMKEEPNMEQDRNTSSLLPQEVEDRLRMEFSNFVALDIIDKLLLSCVMSGMNIAEFAKMLWFPYSIVDPKTRTVKAITKQAAHARWINICKRFPIFMSVAISSAKDNKKALAKLRKFINDPNGEEPVDKFQNGKMSAVYAKAARKAREEEERKQAERDRKQRAMQAARQATSQSQKKASAQAKKGSFPTRKEDCLPGLF